jgi:XTP/dITP diphosphohydrolase
MVKLLVATNNRGKVREYEEILEEGLPGIEITFPAHEGLDLDVEESGETFEENARLKAVEFARVSGLLTLADDSGLEVDALGGAPGVYSARYAGPGTTDADRYRRLLTELAGVPPKARSARFRCVVALAGPEGVIGTAQGAVEGEIGFEPRGSMGFGYDPVFLVEGYDRLTMAELPPDEKNRISHRARALEAAMPLLKQAIERDTLLSSVTGPRSRVVDTAFSAQMPAGCASRGCSAAEEERPSGQTQAPRSGHTT